MISIGSLRLLKHASIADNSVKRPDRRLGSVYQIKYPSGQSGSFSRIPASNLRILSLFPSQKADHGVHLNREVRNHHDQNNEQQGIRIDHPDNVHVSPSFTSAPV